MLLRSGQHGHLIPPDEAWDALINGHNLRWTEARIRAVMDGTER